jgi:hypothetical protein
MYEQGQDMMEMGAAQTAPAPSSPLQNMRVFPVKGKVPLIKGWQDSAPIDLDALAGWQTKYSGCNFGAALDADTFVIDCDSHEATSALYDLGEAHGGIPATLTTITGRGFHFWFHTPVAVRNGVGVLPGIDVKAKGGLVVVPPSLHANGSHYQFADISSPIADAPEWILRLVTGADSGSTKAGANAETPRAECAADARSELTVPAKQEPEPFEELTPFEKDVACRGWEKRLGPGYVPPGRSPLALRIALEPQNVAKGMRNAALFAYLCRLRSEGKPDASIRSEAWRVVARIPDPLSKFEVGRVIANALKFDGTAAGNTLADAWRMVEQVGVGATNWYRFLLLVEQLAEMQPDSRKTILLPVCSIGTLTGVCFTQVAKWRQRAVKMGILSRTASYVRHRLADEFAVKAGFSPLADGPAMYEVKRGRRPKTKPVELDQAA